MNKVRTFLLQFLILVFFFFYYARSYSKLPIGYWDEALWIGKSYFFELFINGDISNPLWKTAPAYDEPKLGEFLYGAVLFPYYLTQKDTTQDADYNYRTFLEDNNLLCPECIVEQYRPHAHNQIRWGPHDNDTAQNLMWKYGVGFAKTINVIIRARKVNVYLLALAVLTAYFIGVKTGGTVVGFLTAFLFGMNNLLIKSSLVAHSEAFFLVLFNVGILLLLIIHTKKSRSLIYILLFSAVSGLCVSTKLNGALLLILHLLLSFVETVKLMFQHKAKEIHHAIKASLLPIVLSYLIFISLNPFLYPNPIQNTYTMYRWRVDQLRLGANETPDDALPTVYDRAISIYSNFFGYEKSELFNGIAIFPSSWVFLQRLNGLFFLIGFLTVLLPILRKKTSWRNEKTIFLTVFLIVQIVLLLYLKVGWNRYYLPLTMFFLFFQSLGIVSIIRYAHKRIVTRSAYQRIIQNG